MKNEELKEKMVKIIINAIWKDAEADYDSTDESEAISIADALIAAGIGDVNKFADTLASKIPCHSYYYGDSIVCAIYALKQGVEIKDVKPVNISEFLVDELRRKLKEAEHRAEVAENALMNAVKIILYNCDANPNNTDYFYKRFLQESKKELQ